jgi:perosamine synthetase
MGKQFWWQDFDDVGYNFRMTDIQAAVGRVQLRKLDELNARRAANAARLDAGLKDIPGITLPTTLAGCTHTYHLYPILIDPDEYGLDKTDFIYDMLHERGIKVGAHYNPLNWSTAFKNRGYHEGQFPNAERVGHRLVTLPVGPRLTSEALDYLIESIRELCRG